MKPLIESPLMVLALLFFGIAAGAAWVGFQEWRHERRERVARFRRLSRVGRDPWPKVDRPGRPLNSQDNQKVKA